MISPWLFFIHMDGVVREGNAKMFGRGLSLFNSDDREYDFYHEYIGSRKDNVLV